MIRLACVLTVVVDAKIIVKDAPDVLIHAVMIALQAVVRDAVHNVLLNAWVAHRHARINATINVLMVV